MSTEDTKIKIEKFQGDNYALWKFKMEMLLTEKELWACATEEGMPPAGDQHRGNWDKKAQRARALICLSLANEQLGKVMKCTTPKQVLAVLDGEYQSTAAANKILLKKRLFRFKMLDDAQVEISLSDCVSESENVCF